MPRMYIQVRVFFGAQVVGSGGSFSSRLTGAQLVVPPGHFTDAPRLGQPPRRQTIPSLLLTDEPKHPWRVQRTVMLRQGSIRSPCMRGSTMEI
jgi:hypothetical protein